MQFDMVFNKTTGVWEEVKRTTKKAVSKYGPSTATLVVGTAAMWLPEVSMAATTAEGKDIQAYIADAKLIAAGAISVIVVLFGAKIWKKLTGGV